MELKEKFFLVVLGNFERPAIEYDQYPSEEEIINQIIKQNGKSARVEKRYVIASKEKVVI